jgi:hypothetical protein
LKFHWTRAQAFLAVGNYDAADEELREMVGPGGQLPTPAEIGAEVAGQVGKCVLDSQPCGGQLNQHVWIAIRQAELQTYVSEIARVIGLQGDITTLRGVVALEAGNIPRAREAFQSALVFSPNRMDGGQLEFSGKRIARDGLTLIGGEARPLGR